jgi:hypothetical protein
MVKINRKKRWTPQQLYALDDVFSLHLLQHLFSLIDYRKSFTFRLAQGRNEKVISGYQSAGMGGHASTSWNLACMIVEK